ncbi:hypothetical protein CLU79DRAFT_714307, partial [Phycomyces nitens]
MTSSATISDLPEQGTLYQRKTPTKSDTLWSQIVSSEQVSLTHNSQPIQSNENNVIVMPSHVWRNGRSPGSVIFDVTGRKSITQEGLIELVHDQYPFCHCILFHKDGPRRLLEINFSPQNNMDTQQACQTGLHFPNENTTVLATSGLETGAIIQCVCLSRLPIFDLSDLLYGLQASLVPYGRVLDVGICREPKFQTFLGTGYTILDIHPTKSGEKYPRMPHNIQWMDTTDGFHTTMSSMPIWCQYCHADGHDHQNCPESPANKRQCWNCNQSGHVRDQC